MKITGKAATGIVLAAAIAISPAACFAETAQEEDTAIYEKEGLQLSIPGEYANLLMVDMPNDEKDTLFTVSEAASIEAAGEDVDGAGWLFSITRIDDDELHNLLCGDMSGQIIFATDGNGTHYVQEHPTDVRLFREDNAYTDEAMEQWTKLNEWAATVRDTFVEENEGLTKESYGNSELDIMLSQIAYQDDTNYTISTTEFGPLDPAGTDPAPFLEKLMNGVTYNRCDDMEAPDGEYVVLTFPDYEMRFDFFFMDGYKNIIRRTTSLGDGEEFVEYYEAVFEDDTQNSTDIMQEWYNALAETNGKK